MTEPTRSQVEAAPQTLWDAQDREETQYAAMADAIAVAKPVAWSDDMRIAPRRSRVRVEDTGGKIEIAKTAIGESTPLAQIRQQEASDQGGVLARRRRSAAQVKFAT